MSSSEEDVKKLTKKNKTKKIIDATLWEIKYFIVISLLKKVSLAPKIGKIEIIFISNLNQKKNRVWEENLNKILIKTINLKPAIGDKNIITHF